MTLTNTINQHRKTGRGRLLVVAIAIIAAVGAVAAGQGFSGGSRRVSRHHTRPVGDSIEIVRHALERGSPWLDLVKVTDQQRAQLLQIVDRHEPALQQLESERNHLAKEFSSALSVDVLNSTDMEHVRLEARTLSEQAIDESATLVTEAVQVLTPEQRIRLAALWRAH